METRPVASSVVLVVVVNSVVVAGRVVTGDDVDVEPEVDSEREAMTLIEVPGEWGQSIQVVAPADPSKTISAAAIEI